MSAWDDLVACAVQGTARRVPDVARWLPELGEDAAVLGGEPPERLLDAAALLTARRRAGRLPVIGLVPAEPAPAESRPTAPEVSDLLELLDSALLPELLDGLQERGLIVAPEAITTLLAVTSTNLLAPALAACGARGPWLHAQLCEADPERWATPTRVSTGDDEPWRLGDPATRLQWLAEARRAIPDQAVDAAAAALSGRHESADFRSKVVTLLADDPRPEDEPLLQAALDDRAKVVRTAAAQALQRGRYAAYAGRMGARVRDWVRLHADSEGRRVLVVEPPVELDDAARRDLGPSAGSRSEWLTTAVAATPLRVWADLGTAQEACELLATPEWEEALREGWARRALTEDDAGWARALLGTSPAISTPARLTRVLPMTLQAAVAKSLLMQLSGVGASQAVDWLVATAAPWPPDLLDEVLAALPSILRDRSARGSQLLHRIAYAEHPGAYRELERLAPELGPAQIAPVSRAITTMRARLEIRQALDASAARVAAERADQHHRTGVPDPDPLDQPDQPDQADQPDRSDQPDPRSPA